MITNYRCTFLWTKRRHYYNTFSQVKSRDSANIKDLSYAVDLNRGIFTYIPTSNDEDANNLVAEYEYTEEDIF